MADMIGDALAFLNDQLTENASVTAIYRRSVSCVTLSVVIEAAFVSPLTVLAAAVADRDMTQPSPDHADHLFSFAAAELVIDNELTRPEEGDTIELTDDAGVLRTYRIATTIDGQRPWKFLNGYESGSSARLQINTRLVCVELP